MRILVTDGEQRASLATVRSLGRAGHEVVVAAPTPRSLAGSSRYACASVVVPDPLARPEAFAEALVTAAGTEGAQALFPITDASLGVALSVRGVLEERGVLLPFAEREAYQGISDKRRVLDEAARLGIAGPAQVVVECLEAAPAADLEALPFPVVVKPSRSVVGTGSERRKTKVTYAGDPDELRGRLLETPAAAYPVLLQERIVGPGVGVFLLLWGGKVAAAFGHRRLREKPPSGGVSVLRESAPIDAALVERSTALLRAFDWRGPAMVEYKVDARTGTPHIMEINGRYWGSLQLAIDAGVDFPAIHMDLATGRRRAPVTRYVEGVRTRWVLGDLDHLIARLRHSKEKLGLPPSAPGRARAVVDFLWAFRPGIRNEVFRWSDPRPGVTEAAEWLKLGG